MYFVALSYKNYLVYANKKAVFILLYYNESLMMMVIANVKVDFVV